MARILLKLRASRISNGPRNSNHAVDFWRKSSHAVRLPAFRSISFCHLIVILRNLPLVSLLRRARFRLAHDPMFCSCLLLLTAQEAAAHDSLDGRFWHRHYWPPSTLMRLCITHLHNFFV